MAPNKLYPTHFQVGFLAPFLHLTWFYVEFCNVIYLFCNNIPNRSTKFSNHSNQIIIWPCHYRRIFPCVYDILISICKFVSFYS